MVSNKQYANKGQKQKVTETNYDPLVLRYFSDYPYAKEMCELTKAREHSDIKPDPILVSYFEAREKAIDKIVIERGINKGIKYFIEFAGGFSTRPLWMAIKYPQINFIDTDQTESVIKEKRKYIRTILGYEPKNLHYAVFDIVEGTGLENLMKLLPDNEPRMGMYAGLLRYKNHGQKAEISRMTSNILGEGGICVTCDVRTKTNIQNAINKVNPDLNKMVMNQSQKFGIDFSANEFDTNEQFIELFQGNGYRKVELINFGDLVSDLSCLNNPELFPNKNDEMKDKVREFYRGRKLAVMNV